MVIFNVFDKNLAFPPVNITLTSSYFELILSIKPFISLHTPPITPVWIEVSVESPGKLNLLDISYKGRLAV